MIKKFLLGFTLLLGTFAFTSCSEDAPEFVPDEKVETVIKLSSSENFIYDAKSQLVSIGLETGSGEYCKLAISAAGTGESFSWLSEAIYSRTIAPGIGMMFMLPENTSPLARRAKLVFTAVDAEPVEIILEQEGLLPPIIPTEEGDKDVVNKSTDTEQLYEVYVPGDGNGETTVKVVTYGPSWTARLVCFDGSVSGVMGDWAIFNNKRYQMGEEFSGINKDEITIKTVSPNATTEYIKDMALILTYGEETITIRLFQAPLPKQATEIELASYNYNLGMYETVTPKGYITLYAGVNSSRNPAYFLYQTDGAAGEYTWKTFMANTNTELQADDTDNWLVIDAGREGMNIYPKTTLIGLHYRMIDIVGYHNGEEVCKYQIKEEPTPVQLLIAKIENEGTEDEEIVNTKVPENTTIEVSGSVDNFANPKLYIVDAGVMGSEDLTWDICEPDYINPSDMPWVGYGYDPVTKSMKIYVLYNFTTGRPGDTREQDIVVKFLGKEVARYRVSETIPLS